MPARLPAVAVRRPAPPARAARAALVATALAAATLAAAPLAAQTILGTPRENGNCIPFGCSEFARVQQVYAASAFGPGPITITGLTFFNSFSETVVEDVRLTLGTYTISLSTTARTVNALDLSDLNTNRGADYTTFRTFVVGGMMSSAPSFTITGAPFVYDPSLGNLLLEINAEYDEDRANDGTAAYIDRAGASTESSRTFCATAGCNVGVAQAFALITRFETGPQQVVPEPGTWALLGTGLVAMGVVARRRRATA